MWTSKRMLRLGTCPPLGEVSRALWPRNSAKCLKKAFQGLRLQGWESPKSILQVTACPNRMHHSQQGLETLTDGHRAVTLGLPPASCRWWTQCLLHWNCTRGTAIQSGISWPQMSIKLAIQCKLSKRYRSRWAYRPWVLLSWPLFHHNVTDPEHFLHGLPALAWLRVACLQNKISHEKRPGTSPKYFMLLSCSLKVSHRHFSKSFHRAKVAASY